MDKRNLIILTVVLAVFISITAYVFWDNLSSFFKTNEGASATSPSVEKVPEFTIEEISNTLISGLTVPDFHAPISFPENMPDGVRQTFKSQIDATQKTLENTPNDYNALLNLGILRKIANDYKGAIIVWEYVSALYPTDVVSFSNLGDTYHYYLKDYKLAEKNLLKTIEINPSYILGYKGLYDLYTLSYKEKISEVPKLLASGLAKNSDNYDLLIMMAAYYKDTGDKPSAISYYTRALAVAPENTKSYIQEEINKLK